jgi:hypothetical protein
MTLEDAVTNILDRLADKENQVWSRAEIAEYFKDGYDQFCRRGKCLWDVWIIPNISPTANWSSDLERYHAETTPGFGFTDERFGFTAEDERGKPYGGDSNRYPGGSASMQPAVATRQGDVTQFKSDFSNLTTTTTQVKGGTLPQSVVEVSRVAYDERTLTGISSQRMRELDPRYETRAGEPQWFLFDKDGLFYVRVVPAAQGNASYDTVNSGGWGNLNQRVDSNGDIIDTIDGVASNLSNPDRIWGFEEAADGPYFEQAGILSLTASGTVEQGTGKGGGNAIFTSQAANGSRLTFDRNFTPATGNWTISLWHKKDNTNPFSGSGHIIFDGDGSTTANSRFRLNWPQQSSPTAPTLQISDGSSWTTISGFSNISNDVWYLVTIAYDGTDCHMWVYDGDSYDETFSATVTPNASPTSTGAIHGRATGGRVNGTTDQLYVWNSFVTQANVRSVMDNKNPTWGILRERNDIFAAGGPHGNPTQIHPHNLNIKVEGFRLGRDLDSYEVELPLAYQKYPIFWAMYRALERTGGGQDLQLADHFKGRFEIGVSRIEAKVREMDKERAGRMGGLRKMVPYGLGDPVPPYPYGVPF